MYFNQIQNLKRVISFLTEFVRNCEIKSIAPYGVFVEIAPGREVGLTVP